MQIDLSGKVAVVTGGSGELGRVMVRTLSDCGASLAIHYFKGKQRAEKLRDELRAKKRKAIAVCADVSQLADVLAMQRAVTEELGDAEIIVNNAVSQYAWKTILEQPAEDFDSQYRSCVLQNVYMAKAFVPAMIKRNRGRIIGINTECAMQCWPNQGAYVAGKRGMDGILRVLAREVGAHQITVNMVAPGWTISDSARAAGTEKQPDYEKNVPMKRRGTDQEIANVVAFLASDLASFITGAYVPVNGGNVMPAI